MLRELVAHPGPNPVTELAGRLSASPDEVAGLCGRLVDLHLARVQASGVEITETGVERAATLEDEANEAMRAYVIERPHTATVYGLVASMQSGRFTVEDLLAFLAEGPTRGRVLSVVVLIPVVTVIALFSLIVILIVVRNRRDP